MVGGFERNRKLLLGAHLQIDTRIRPFEPYYNRSISILEKKNNYIIKEPTVNWIGHLNESTTFSMANFL
jgi:hypothetical protein